MCGPHPHSPARICWALTALFFLISGTVLFFYGGIAPFRQPYSDLVADGVQMDSAVGLFANCDDAANEIASTTVSGPGDGVDGNVTSRIPPPSSLRPRQTPTQTENINQTQETITNYIRDRCDRRKSPYFTIVIVTGIMSFLTGLLGILLLMHFLRSLKYLYPVMAGASLALLVISTIRMLIAYHPLSKYIDCTGYSRHTINILTKQLSAVCYDGESPTQQKPVIARILNELIPFWVGLPLLFLTLLGLSWALSWLLKKGPKHRLHERQGSYDPYGTPESEHQRRQYMESSPRSRYPYETVPRQTYGRTTYGEPYGQTSGTVAAPAPGSRQAIQ